MYLCGDTGGLLPESVAGQPVQQLGLNLSKVSTELRRVFTPDRACGAGYLSRPSAIKPDEYGTDPFGLLFFLRQTIRYEMERATEERLSLHSYLITRDSSRATRAQEQAKLVHGLMEATRVRDPAETGLERPLLDAEYDLANELRRPSEVDIAARVRHVVWPIGAFVII